MRHLGSSTPTSLTVYSCLLSLASDGQDGLISQTCLRWLGRLARNDVGNHVGSNVRIWLGAGVDICNITMYYPYYNVLQKATAQYSVMYRKQQFNIAGIRRTTLRTIFVACCATISYPPILNTLIYIYSYPPILNFLIYLYSFECRSFICCKILTITRFNF
jgi:hypothetical protein